MNIFETPSFICGPLCKRPRYWSDRFCRPSVCLSVALFWETSNHISFNV